MAQDGEQKMTETADLFDPELSFKQLAEIALEVSGGDGEAATKRLIAYAKSNPDFLERHALSLITRRMTDAVTHENKDRRKRLGGSRSDILDYPIWGGRLLGNVSLKDLGESGAKFLRDAETRAQKGRFFARLATEGLLHGIDGTTSGGIRNLPSEILEDVFAETFGDGAVQQEINFGE